MSRKIIYNEEDIVDKYKKGYTQKELAELYNSYNTSIRRILIKHKVKLRGTANVQSFVKHNPFRRNDERSDYFLGLLLTDGCISGNKITLGLKEEDIYMLEEFSKFCGNKVKVTKYFHKKHNKFQYEVGFRDSRGLIIDYLNKLGNFKNKSFDCKIYKKLNYNILRGIIDGDGSIHKSYITICGKSLIFINQIKFFLEKEGYFPKIYFRKYDNLVYLSLNKKDSIKLGHYLYNNAQIFLKRKFEKWSHFSEMRRKNNTLNSGNEMVIQS